MLPMGRTDTVCSDGVGSDTAPGMSSCYMGLSLHCFPIRSSPSPRFEALWALVNHGMAAGVAGWVALDVARPRRLALTAGGLAMAGYLGRAVISGVVIANPSATVDGPIVGTILLTVLGLGGLGVTILLGRTSLRLAGLGAAVHRRGRTDYRSVLLDRQSRPLHPARPLLGSDVAAPRRRCPCPQPSPQVLDHDERLVGSGHDNGQVNQVWVPHTALPTSRRTPQVARAIPIGMGVHEAERPAIHERLRSRCRSGTVWSAG